MFTTCVQSEVRALACPLRSRQSHFGYHSLSWISSQNCLKWRPWCGTYTPHVMPISGHSQLNSNRAHGNHEAMSRRWEPRRWSRVPLFRHGAVTATNAFVVTSDKYQFFLWINGCDCNWTSEKQKAKPWMEMLWKRWEKWVRCWDGLTLQIWTRGSRIKWKWKWKWKSYSFERVLFKFILM